MKIKTQMQMQRQCILLSRFRCTTAAQDRGGPAYDLRSIVSGASELEGEAFTAETTDVRKPVERIISLGDERER